MLQICQGPAVSPAVRGSFLPPQAADTARDEREALHSVLGQVAGRLTTDGPLAAANRRVQLQADLPLLYRTLRDHHAAAAELADEVRQVAPHWLPRWRRTECRRSALLSRLAGLAAASHSLPAGDSTGSADLRRQALDVIRDLQAVHGLENDLVWECFHTDLGAGE